MSTTTNPQSHNMDIILTPEEAKGILATVALADHVGDCLGAVSLLARRMGYHGRIDIEGLRKADMLPQHLKD
jgi:hypothetical protein